MASLSAISFAIATTLAGYLASLCLTPPNPSPSQERGKDSIAFVNHPAVVLGFRLIPFGFSLHHAVVTILLDSHGPAAFQHVPLNPHLFGWTRASSTCLLLIFIGATIRLAAFGALGSRFTFALTRPDELNTTGMYAYVQHPSYTGILLVIIPFQLLFLRWDGWPAYWIPRSILDSLHGWGLVCYAAMAVLNIMALRLRISEEETLLKEVFGKEWVVWNRKTKRFIPGLF